MAKLQVNNLHKMLNDRIVLQGVCFEAQKSDVIALLGTSGSGKSTLLRCLNLLTIPDSGEIQIDQQKIQFIPNKKMNLSAQEIVALRKRVGMVFQQFNLWAHMTVLENLITAPIQVLKQKKSQAVDEAHHLLTKVGLQDKANYYPAQLSGGQQQRAAIARSLMMKPDVMLFDEPTSALDPEMVGEVLTVIQRLASDGMTMLIATHELSFAKRVANRAIFLDGGIILEQGSTQQMFNSPTTMRLQRFLDAMQHDSGEKDEKNY